MFSVTTAQPSLSLLAADYWLITHTCHPSNAPLYTIMCPGLFSHLSQDAGLFSPSSSSCSGLFLCLLCGSISVYLLPRTSSLTVVFLVLHDHFHHPTGLLPDLLLETFREPDHPTHSSSCFCLNLAPDHHSYLHSLLLVTVNTSLTT